MAQSRPNGSAPRRLSRLLILGLITGTSAVAIPSIADAAPARPAAPVERSMSTATLASKIFDEFALLQLDVQRSTLAFRLLRGDLAERVGAELGIDPLRLAEAWSAASPKHQLALYAALSQLGVPYKRNASIAGVGFDCSGLTTYAWGRAGVALTRQSGSQIRAAKARTAATAQAGDLTYYPGHVMMYLGVDDTMIHSPFTGRSVEVIHASRPGRLRYGDPTS